MRISDIRLARVADSARVTALVTWENAERPHFELFFETNALGRDDLVAAPEAFLTACAVAAKHRGESRVLVEGSVCPRLAEGLPTAMVLLRSWFGGPSRPITIEATDGFRALEQRIPPRSAVYLTGGVDSTHLLQVNREDYSTGHPGSFADAISLHGHLRAESDDSPWNARTLDRLRKTAEARDLSLVAVRTNLWDLDPDLPLVTEQSLSSALAAAAHLFPGRWSRVSIASGRDVASESPRGTHPLLDPLYSSSAVEIRHDPSRRTRFERLRALNGEAASELIVCLAYPGPPYLNCGECEKCVRTMTGLVALGRLSQSQSFRHTNVTSEMIQAVPVAPIEIIYWEELQEPLMEVGRADLVQAIEGKLAETRRLARWHDEAGWKGQLRKLDRELLGGRLQELRKRLT